MDAKGSKQRQEKNEGILEENLKKIIRKTFAKNQEKYMKKKM